MVVVLGADGCRGGGWIVARFDGALRWDWADDTAALLVLAGDAVLAMDVPIGLPSPGSLRQCDVQARLRLGPRRSSVFAAPPRSVLGCATYAEARPLAPSLSAQAFGLVPRIREVDEALRSRGPRVHDRVIECHPELAFATMGELPLATKKSAAGALQRIALLESVWGRLPADVPVGAALDDALDAAACAWVARRWATGAAESLGDETDELGLPMRIVV